MPIHTEHRHSRHSPQQIFRLVADIEKYPQFLPWCKAARITERGENYVVADLVISFSGFSEKYTSKVYLYPPGGEKTPEIKVELVRGPFKHLSNHWKFETPENGPGCDVSFELSFEFRSKILEKLIGLVFEKALLKMVSAFEKRADELFGKV